MKKVFTSWKYWLLTSLVLFSCTLSEMKPIGYYKNPTPTLMDCGQTINTDLEGQLVGLINQARQAKGLAAYTLNDLLTGAAHRHSTDMACNNFMDTTGSDGATWHDLIVQNGYLVKYGGITVAGGYANDTTGLLRVWEKPADSLIYDTNATEIGIGVVSKTETQYQIYWTLLIALPVP
jgi:uncharacterized protein YkwD